jgi:hypothetical protein
MGPLEEQEGEQGLVVVVVVVVGQVTDPPAKVLRLRIHLDEHSAKSIHGGEKQPQK